MKSHLPLFERNRSTLLAFKLFTQFKQTIFDLAQDEINTSKLYNDLAENKITFIVGGIFAILENWCENDCKVEERIILENLDLLTSSILNS